MTEFTTLIIEILTKIAEASRARDKRSGRFLFY